MTAPKIYRPGSIDFEKWIRESVWLNGNTKMSRRECLDIFAEDCRKWIQHYGYKLSHSWGLKAVANWMYSMSVVYKACSFPTPLRVRYPTPDHRDWQEDFEYFHATVDTIEIGKFLDRWKYADDFHPDTRLGQHIQTELAHILYTYLNLEDSENGRKIAAFVETSSSESEGEHYKRKSTRDQTDAYLQDTKEGFHGGGWSKV